LTEIWLKLIDAMVDTIQDKVFIPAIEMISFGVGIKKGLYIFNKIGGYSNG